MSTSHWAEYHLRWSRLGPPLRPHANDVRALREAASARPGPTLLLGVTQELADVGPDVTAVDKSEAMVRGLWPGDTDRRRAVVADWLELPFTAGSFVAAVGDGTLNALEHPGSQERLFVQLERVLRPGAIVAIRVFRRPSSCESLDQVVADAKAGRAGGFHAFKWRFAMALAAERGDPNLPVATIHAAFVERFPDRSELVRQTRWNTCDVDTIDVYRESSEIYSFPTAAELETAAPAGFRSERWIEASGYELAERCPVWVLARR